MRPFILGGAAHGLFILLAASAVQGQPMMTPLVASGSADHTIHVIDSNGKVSQNFLAHDGPVNGLAISPDGKRIYSCGDDKAVKVWNVDDGSLENTLEDHEKAVLCLALSPDGRLLATGSADRKVKLWNAFTGTLVRSISGHSQSVRSVAWSANGQRFASGGADGIIQVWTADGQPSGTLIAHEEAVTGIAWAGDGRTLVSSSTDGFLKVWKVDDLSLAARVRAHPKGVSAISLFVGGKVLATAGGDLKIKLWALNGNMLSELATAPIEKSALAMTWSRDGRLLIVGGTDRSVRYLNGKDLAPVHKVDGHTGAVNTVAAGPG